MLPSLTERDGKLRDHWFIACLSSELTDIPIQRILYDKPYVLFRDQTGKAVCLLDRCLHRHALLSEGECRKGNLSCPYHGWEYDQTGKVVHVPSEGSSFKTNHQTRSFPVNEKEEVIWVWIADGEPTDAPPWTFPRINDPGWIHYFMVTDFENEVTNLAENFMDVPHTVYVHKGWFRNVKETKVPMSVVTKNGRVLVTYQQEKDEIAPLLRPLMNPSRAPMKHTDEFIFPNITCVEYSYGDKYGTFINSQITPVSSMKSRVYTYIAYRMLTLNTIIKPFIQYYTRQVIIQDVEIMQNQAKSLAFDPKTTFRSTPADEVHKAIERLRYKGIENPSQVYEFDLKADAEFWI